MIVSAAAVVKPWIRWPWLCVILKNLLEPDFLSKWSPGAFSVPFKNGELVLVFGGGRLKKTGFFCDEICQKKWASCSLERLWKLELLSVEVFGSINNANLLACQEWCLFSHHSILATHFYPICANWALIEKIVMTHYHVRLILETRKGLQRKRKWELVLFFNFLLLLLILSQMSLSTPHPSLTYTHPPHSPSWFFFLMFIKLRVK